MLRAQAEKSHSLLAYFGAYPVPEKGDESAHADQDKNDGDAYEHSDLLTLYNHPVSGRGEVPEDRDS